MSSWLATATSDNFLKPLNFALVGLMPSSKIFSFSELDDLAHAVNRSVNIAGICGIFATKRLGPLVELWFGCRNGRMPSFSMLGFPPMKFIENLDAGRSKWLCPVRRNHGFLCLGTAADAETDRREATTFLMDARAAARRCGYPNQLFDVLEIAAFAWLDNVYEHSQATNTGVLAFALNHDGGAEIIVADAGEGLVASLRRNEYGHYREIVSAADALRTALTDGESRFKPPPGLAVPEQRGLGFGQLFRRLATLDCAVRFRSGDYILRHEGAGLQLNSTDVLPTIDFRGFLAWLRIGAPPRSAA